MTVVPPALLDAPTAVAAWTTRRGNLVRAEHRPETTDAMTLEACIVHDEYGLAGRDWEGVAVDVGAHIGGATLALLADNPQLHVVAVEALPANADLLRRNVARNGWADRCTVMEAGASCQPGSVIVAYGAGATPFEAAHRFIGGNAGLGFGPKGERVVVPGVSLTSIVAQFGDVALVKIDCEGCEWSFLDDPAVARVAEIRGEVHPRGDRRGPDIRSLLEPTHDVDVDDTADWGPFRAILRAAR